MKLRDYQQDIYAQLTTSSTDDVVQLDTGGGKTPIIAAIIDASPTLCIAHRNYLVEQISATLAKISKPHHIIATSRTQKACMLNQRHLTAPSQCYVASIQSLISWHKRGILNLDTSLPFTIIFDEAHHVADKNQWAKLAEIFPNARKIGFTATPCRLDGKALHKTQGGLFDRLIQAETLRENSTQKLIAKGFLSDYEVFAPPTQLQMQELKMGSTGDYTGASLEYVVNRRNIVADVVKTHCRLAQHKKTLVFCVSIENAKVVANAFKDTGLSAAYIASDLSGPEITRRIDAFKRGDIQVLCNVDMVTEGFDMPQIECVQMLRPTASLGLYRQIVGRVLRPKPDGSKAIIIDHVCNTMRHGLPDDHIEWSLHGTPKNKSEPVVACESCEHVFNIYLRECPSCGLKNPILSKSSSFNVLVDVGIISIDLVRQVRSKLAQQEINEQRLAAKEAAELRFTTEYLPTKFDYGHDTVGAACKRIATWFVEQNKSAYTISQINAFTQSPPDKKYWINHFTLKDVLQNNSNKCHKELAKWLKSKS